MKKQVLIASIIISTSLILHYLTVPMFFGLSIMLGLIGFVASVRFLSFYPATVTAAVLAGLLYLIDGNLAFSLVYFSHTVINAWLYRNRERDLFTWVFLTTLIMGLIYLLLAFLLPGLAGVNILILFTYTQNSIILLLFALAFDLITFYFPYIPYVGRFFSVKQPILFGQIIFNVIVVVAVIPLIGIAVINTVLGISDMFTYFENQAHIFENSVNDYVEQLDEEERDYFLSTSNIQLDSINQSIDQFSLNTGNDVYIFNSDQTLFTKSVDAINHHLMEEKLSDGQWRPWKDGQAIWVNNQGQAIHDWHQGYFVHRTSLFDKEMVLYMGLEDQFVSFLLELYTYYGVIIAVFLLAVLFGKFSDRILTRQLNTLNKLTRELPATMTTVEAFEVRETKIIEFAQLGNSISYVGERLKNIYFELQDKTEQLKQSERALYHVAHYDNLTQLPNRRSFYRDVELLIESETNVFAILFIDFDEFKLVNDTYGHSGGDKLLVDIANRFLNFEKERERLIFYRLAGDEFIAVITDPTREQIDEMGAQLLDMIDQPMSYADSELYISASVGVSFYPTHGSTLDELLNAADQAMYEMKKQGRQGLNYAPTPDDQK